MEKEIQQNQNPIWQDLGIDLPEGEGYVDFDSYEPPENQPELFLADDDRL